MAEGFPGEDIRKMNLDEGDRNPEQRIAQSNARVGQRTRVNEYEVSAIGRRRMNAIDQHAFGIALHVIKGEGTSGGKGFKLRHHIIEGLTPIDFGLPCS